MKVDKVLALLGFILLNLVLWFIATTPPATGYELSIYDVYPRYFWFFFVGSIILNAASEEEFSLKQIDFKEEYNIQTRYMIASIGNHHKLKGHKFVIDTLVIIGNKELIYYGIVQKIVRENLRKLVEV